MKKEYDETIKNLNSIKKELEKKYKLKSNKNIYDTIVSIESAIYSIGLIETEDKIKSKNEN